MWDQCTGAYDIPSAHEIDDDRAKEFFLPYGMEVAGCGGFLLPFSCLLMWTWGPSLQSSFFSSRSGVSLTSKLR
jgi:hypothetical protein